MAPGVRLGWFETSPQIKSRLMSCGLLDSGGSLNAVMAGIVGTAMELGLMARHIKTLRMTYKQRMDAVCEVLIDLFTFGFRTCKTRFYRLALLK